MHRALRPVSSRPGTGVIAPPARVAGAGATGCTGQGLLRVLARHPEITLTAAMSSAARSTVRGLPALARGWRVDASGRAVLVSVIDNFLKGAAGQAVQNLNVMLGLDERTGLV